MSTSSLDVERIVGEEDRPTNQLYDEGRMRFCVGVSVCTIFTSKGVHHFLLLFDVS